VRLVLKPLLFNNPTDEIYPGTVSGVLPFQESSMHALVLAYPAASAKLAYAP